MCPTKPPVLGKTWRLSTHGGHWPQTHLPCLCLGHPSSRTLAGSVLPLGPFSSSAASPASQGRCFPGLPRLRPSASCGPGRGVSVCCRDPGQLASGPGTWHCPGTSAHRVSFCVPYRELRPSGAPWGISGSLRGNRNTIRFCFLFLIRQTRCFYGHNR